MTTINRLLTGTITALAAATLAVSGATMAVAVPTQPSGHGSPVRQLVLDGTITRAQWISVKAAVRTAREATHDSMRTAALAPLVADGTVSSAEADAIVAAQRRHGLHALIRSGDITPTEAREVRQALRDQGRVDHVVVLHDTLAGLVTKGTITQEQADAIEAAAIAGRLGGGRATRA
jgi:hypothetical protein